MKIHETNNEISHRCTSKYTGNSFDENVRLTRGVWTSQLDLHHKSFPPSLGACILEVTSRRVHGLSRFKRQAKGVLSVVYFTLDKACHPSFFFHIEWLWPFTYGRGTLSANNGFTEANTST